MVVSSKSRSETWANELIGMIVHNMAISRSIAATTRSDRGRDLESRGFASVCPLGSTTRRRISLRYDDAERSEVRAEKLSSTFCEAREDCLRIIVRLPRPLAPRPRPRRRGQVPPASTLSTRPGPSCCASPCAALRDRADSCWSFARTEAPLLRRWFSFQIVFVTVATTSLAPVTVQSARAHERSEVPRVSGAQFGEGPFKGSRIARASS
jgi:hypothetical protein